MGYGTSKQEQRLLVGSALRSRSAAPFEWEVTRPNHQKESLRNSLLQDNVK